MSGNGFFTSAVRAARTAGACHGVDRRKSGRRNRLARFACPARVGSGDRTKMSSTYESAFGTGSLAATAAGGSRTRTALLYYVAVPVALGLLFGWMKSSRTVDWPMAASLGYWVMISWTNWLVCDLGCRLIARTRYGRTMPLWSLLLLGALLARPFLYLLNRVLVEGFQDAFVAAELHRPLPDLRAWPFVKSSLPGLVLWTGIGTLMHRFHGFPNYGRTAGAAGDASSLRPPTESFAIPADVPAPADATAGVGTDVERAAAPSVLPGFVARLPAKLGHDVWAVAAEEHYLRVHTERGSALVLYRMSDAVRELAGWDGTQVHRSYWVARRAIERVERTRGQPSLVLRNGLVVPVSRSFRRDAEQAGLLRAAAGD
jgi:hypothetical protein